MKISVVVAAVNARDALASCLESLMGQLTGPSEVSVVDNGSTDGTAAMVRQRYPGVRVFQNDRNLGAARARNQGIAVSRGDWILTLDCDVVLQKGFIAGLMQVLEGADERLGMIQPKILSRTGGAIFSTGIQLTAFRRFHDRGRGQKKVDRFDAHMKIFGPCCAAALYRRRMLEEIKDAHGMFDERFFFLVEDVDLAWRAQRRGWKALFCPGAVCHHQGNSSRTGRRLRQYLCFRNRRLMLEKNEGFAGKIKQGLMSPFYDVPRFVYLSLTNSYLVNPPRL